MSDITRRGRLTFTGRTVRRGVGSKPYAEFRCDCGRLVYVPTAAWRTGERCSQQCEPCRRKSIHAEPISGERGTREKRAAKAALEVTILSHPGVKLDPAVARRRLREGVR